MTNFFRLLPEYLGTRKIKVTICNVPAFITGEVLAAFLSAALGAWKKLTCYGQLPGRPTGTTCSGLV